MTFAFESAAYMTRKDLLVLNDRIRIVASLAILYNAGSHSEPSR